MSPSGKNISNIFFGNPDIASKAKSRFVSYYMSIYFNIISKMTNEIHYLDFFSGPGKFKDGTLTVPLNVLKSTKDINGISYFFNDLYQIESLKNNIINSNFKNSLNKCIFSSDDCSIKDMSKYIPKTGAIISYVDSFSHLLSNTDFIAKLIEPSYSDCVLFINFDNIIRHYMNEKEKKHFLIFFGSEAHFEKMKQDVLCNDKYKWDAKVHLLLKDYVDRLSKEIKRQIFCLPVFFKSSNEASNTSHVILIISKNKKGIICVRESFSPKKYYELDDTLKNTYFNIRKSSFVVFEENPFQTRLFDYNELYYEEILEYININEENAVNIDQLLDIIDEKFQLTNKYCCAFSKKYVKEALHYLEKNEKIKIKCIGKRNNNCFNKNVLIYKEI